MAVKLPASDYPTESEIARLQHEYAILRDLGVPGVIKALGLEPCDKGFALILENIDGQPLSTTIKEKRLDLKASLTIASSIAATLDALHQRHILHKDVTPHNILVTSSGSAVLIDFGLATRLTQEPQRALRPDALEGTLAYLSPEQTGRMNRMVDRRSDLYSLGATLYEALSGEPPFVADDPTELIHSHIARVPVPLRDRVPGLPAVVSDLVAKLLAKTAEDRYQTARGLKADLDECIEQWTATGHIAAFPLARRDASGDLPIPQKLYGRGAELAELFAAFDRVSEGAAELLLVSGYSGVGKSALVQEIHKPIARRGGYFIAGKFDQLQRNIPCAPIAHAFRDLAKQILTEPPGALELWKERLLHALGPNGRLLIDLIPELELVIGPQPPVQELGPSESQNRFTLVFQSFLRVFCTREHALVLFLDDLQWVDPASLKLLQLSLTAEECGYLLIIGAYRDNEVDAAHPLRAAVSELRKAGGDVQEIKLEPLGVEHLQQLLADTLDQSRERVEPLAQLVWDRTQGNPFFVTQLLQQLHRDRILRFDEHAWEWRWDLGRVHDVAATGNVVQFMAAKLQRLTSITQQILQLAACIGHQFDLRLLSIIDEKSPRETAQDLCEALKEGLLLPLNAEYRFVHHAAVHEGASPHASLEFPVSYRFLHDRVQQAAYSLIGEEHSKHVHLRIGRLMLAQAEDADHDPHLFDIVGHMSRGASLLTDPHEKQRLARLCLAAGKRAKAATAYEAAADHFDAGISLLPPTSWGDEYDLTFALHIEQAQAAQLIGQTERAEALLDLLLPKAQSRLHRVHVQGARVLLFTLQLRFADAIDATRAMLALFDIDLPTHQEQRQKALEAELASIEANLAGRRPDELISAPPMTDPEMRELLRLLSVAVTSAYCLGETLLGLVIALQVNISLKHGHSDWSSYGYANYGLLLANVFNRPVEGYAYGELALALEERFKNIDLTGKVYQIVAGQIVFYKRPLRESLSLLAHGYQASMAAGDFAYASYNTLSIVYAKFGVGTELGALDEEVNRYLVLTNRTKVSICSVQHQMSVQLVRSLTGRTPRRDTLDDDHFCEAEFVAALKRIGLMGALGWYYTAKTLLSLLYEDHAEGLVFATEGEKCIPGSPGLYFTFDLCFYSCLIMLALSPGATDAEREQYQARIEAHRDRFRGLSEDCPENFRYKLLLIDAERARVAGRAEAVRLYAQAIEAARVDGFPHHEALANELCAKLYLSLEDTAAAAVHMTAAHAGYLRWGATAKAAHIKEKHSSLILGAMEPVDGAARSRSTKDLPPELLDYTAAFRAVQAIAGEIVTDRVVDRLMRIALADAGAQTGALILCRKDQLILDATLSVDPDALEVGIGAPVETRGDVPRTLLYYVARTRTSVVLEDAAADSRFGSDPAITARKLKSIVCAPLLHQGHLTGLFFLGSTIASVFTPARVELLELLSAQTAISLRNADLLANLEAVSAEVRRANEHLEQEVERSTAELRRANHELSDAYERLQLELAERERLQQQIIGAHQAHIAELSAPLIPITEHIMVMPLIGTLDSRRAAQVLQVALEGAQRYCARFVIVDVTGIKTADSQTVDILLRTARALRLLGSEAILSGLHPQIAQTLASLGIDLGGITARGTLQSAIAYAIGRSPARAA